MSKPYDLQTIMLTLQQFWAARGCLIWQPYHTEVGAGTMNPGTFLRVLGPEPWNVAYVEPSIRPDDGRYGENPNRMQQHYQFQVILKPDPGNPQELYLESLEALGIDLKKHDIRFVEDNWMQPAMGAWGLGWQVWLDGQEITQFTYFQQAGGINLDPVAVEITYGLERIAMPLQGVHDFKDIRWNPDFSYGDVNLQAEQEHSKYYFEIADVERLREAFDVFEAEANSALAAGLVLPAHDFILKCSHAFNVLDTRGAVGVTERQAFFGRLRELARRVSMAYLEQRERLEYPFLDRDLVVAVRGAGAGLAGSEGPDAPQSADTTRSRLAKTADFLLEIGTEELPSSDLIGAMAQLEERVPALLADLRLDYEEIQVMGTPRRLVVQVGALATTQRDLEEKVKGPPADRAFDEEGFPTQAALGFARSKGVDVEALEVEAFEEGRYVVAVARQPGRPARQVLAERLPALIASLQFDKAMRWNASNVAFSRPIRWILALHESERVPFEYAGLQSGYRTRGLRVQDPPEFAVANPLEYINAMADGGIVLDRAVRRARIWREIKLKAREIGGAVPEDPDLLDVVTNEVEAPHVLRGEFDPAYLDLPREVLVAVMKKHQNYFPLEKDGALIPHFITVINGGYQDLDLVARGNADVIRARFADAAFFIQEDRKRSLESYLPMLETLAFQQALGSMLDKTRRIEKLTETLANSLGLDSDEKQVALRAAALSKADLVTGMVVEMTSLQGVMGRYYALDSGEPEPVAWAIEEHYQPRYAGDSAPKSRAGLVVGMADRLDSLVGLFAVGLAPTGAKDPFALRRAALGLVGNLIAWDLDFDLRPAMAEAARGLPVKCPAECMAACLEFIRERLRNLLLDSGARYDIVDALVAAQGHNPASAARGVADLERWVQRDDWSQILPAYARCVRITRDLEKRFKLDRAWLDKPEEKRLYAALKQAEKEVQPPGSVERFLTAFMPLIPLINLFFDEVLVMVEERRMRENRLALLQHIAALADGVVDLSRLEGF